VARVKRVMPSLSGFRRLLTALAARPAPESLANTPMPKRRADNLESKPEIMALLRIMSGLSGGILLTCVTRPASCDRVSTAKGHPGRPGLMAPSTRACAVASKSFRACARLVTAAIAIILVVPALTISALAAEPDYAGERAAMVRTIVTYAAAVGSAIGRDYIAPGVLETMGIVPRHEFVPEAVRHQAYADRPLPIGYGQTISQPFIVALMTDLLQVGPNHVVLEI